MKHNLFLCLLVCALTLLTDRATSQAKSTAKQPNFIVILGEGHGWSSLPIAMDPSTPSAHTDGVKMPNFERIAREGARFTQFYAPSPRCTPSRAALLTGKSPAQLHMTFVGEGKKDAQGGNTKMIPPQAILELPAADKTTAQLLQSNGYAVAHFGKWHLGRANPSTHGFPVNDGANNNGGPDDSDDPSTEQTPRTGKLGVDFILEQAKAGKPFYLQISQYASREDSAQEAMDTVLGQLLQTLEDKNLLANTYIVYTTDHGTPGRNSPLRGGKGHLLEGGIRVPLLIRGPSIKPGSVIRVPATGVDLLPTLAELASVKELPSGLEGGSLVPVLKSGGTGTVKREREPLFFHFPHYDHDNGGPASAVILNNWKLVKFYETDTRQLYDLSKDPEERNDRATSEKARVDDLDRRLTDYLTVVKAQMATKNPGYDPNKPSEAGTKGGGRGGRGGQGKKNGKGGNR